MAKAGRKSAAQPPLSGPPHLDQALSRLAVRQHGVFTGRQLQALGLSARTVVDRAARGRLHRVHRGVYSMVPPTLLKREGRYMAAVLAAGPDAVLSHRDAAVLHELLTNNRPSIDVTVAGRANRGHRGIDVHRSRTLTPTDITQVNNVPCTTIARTLLDLGDVIDRRRHERAFDQAEILERLDLIAIQDQLARNATRPAAAKTRALLNDHYIGSTPTESELEEGFLALCRRAKLPSPELQQWLNLPDGEPPIRVDFLWRAQRVVVETDGVRYHGSHQAMQRDSRKDQRLIAHGFRPIRTGWRQIFFAPDELAMTLTRMLAA